MTTTPIALWLAALRSGEFRQSQGALRNMEGYCCLGVLCEVYRRTTDDGEWLDVPTEEYTDAASTFRVSGHENYLVLPPVVQRWAGLSSLDGHFGGESLTDMNDAGSSFDVIAERIEMAPTGLFVLHSQPRAAADPQDSQ